MSVDVEVVAEPIVFVGKLHCKFVDDCVKKLSTGIEIYLHCLL
jgi:hypothetical protein